MRFARIIAVLVLVAPAAIGPALAQTPAPASQPSTAPSPGASLGPGATAAPAATASPGPTASPAPATMPVSGDVAAANLAKARAEFVAWQSAKIDLSHYIPEAAPQFTADVVKSISDQYLKPLGALKTFTLHQTITAPNAVVYVYRAACANGAIDEAISWNTAGLVQYIRFVPPQS